MKTKLDQQHEFKTSDKVIIEDLGKFDLSQIFELFEGATFQRRIYASHVKQLKKAILNDILLDNIITVFKLDNEKYSVIDGQHRLQALWHLYKEGKKKSHIIILRVVKAKSYSEARDIYLQLNSGKNLTLNDILKTYDDGSIYYFNKLRTVANHYPSSISLSYAQILAILWYSSKKDTSIERKELQNTLTKIEEFEVIRLFDYVNYLYAVVGRNTKHSLYKANVIRPLGRFYWELFEKFNQKKWIRLITILSNDQTIRNMSGSNRTQEAYELIYNYIKNRYRKL